jgi:hypothetical protein
MALLSDPYGTKHPFRRCEHWGGDVAGTSHAVCLHGGRVHVQANGEYGCVFWVRATGADDETPQTKKRGNVG